MKYSNPQIPEGINTSDSHPLKEFVLLAGGALLLLVVLAWGFGEAGARLARFLPFESEAGLVPEGVLQSDAGPELQRYIDELATRVSAELALPPGMQVNVHVSGGDTFNAFATLGGNVLLFRGLLEALPNENALAMLMAHEIAHVVHRDPIVGIGRGAAIQIVAGLVFGDPDLAVLGQAGIYTQLHFNRDMERDADAAALRAVNRLYGHVSGAADLFKVIQSERREQGGGEPPAIFSSHPLDQQRLQAITDTVREHGWRADGPITALPAAYAEWLRDAARRHDKPAD
ncbi:MAG: M48 family metallopeptidase [Gammaproteobacteria bacterium]|nr:M48 family metallopeptidase [Gammaproteobacteria bacterium]